MAFFLIFLLGIISGSFMNVCIYRMPRKTSIAMPPSSCTLCGERIKWFDNIPILSFFILRGRCRSCKGKISLRYPLVEFISGVICVLLYLRFELTPSFFILWYLAGSLIVTSFIDLEFQEIPDKITLPGILIGLIAATAYPELLKETSNFSSFLNSFLGILAGGGSLYLLGFLGEVIFKKQAMGGGDIKLLAMVGAFIGWKLTILAFFLAPFFGVIIGIIAKAKHGKEVIPYGPYLSLGTLLSIFYGEEIIKRIFLI